MTEYRIEMLTPSGLMVRNEEARSFPSIAGMALSYAKCGYRIDAIVREGEERPGYENEAGVSRFPKESHTGAVPNPDETDYADYYGEAEDFLGNRLQEMGTMTHILNWLHCQFGHEFNTPMAMRRT